MLKNKKVLKLGFIGGGLSSAIGQTHYSACRLDGYWDLVSGAFSRNLTTNLETAKAWNVSLDRTYSCWKEFIQCEKKILDAVVILTPSPEHEKILYELLKENVPIICEKSFVSSIEQLEKVKKFYNPKSHFLAVTYNYSGYPMVRELKEKINQGKLGDIQQVHIEMPQEGFIRPPDIAGKVSSPQSWRLQDGIIPTVCLDLGVHLHHLLYFLLEEEPTQVIAEFDNYSSYHNIIDNVQMLLRFKTKKRASFWFSKTAIGCRNGLKIRVYGSKGTAEWLQTSPEELLFSTIDGMRYKIDRGGACEIASLSRYNRMKAGHPAGFIEAFANLYQDFATDLLNWQETDKQQNPYVFGLEHAEKGLKLFQASRRSADSNNWVDIE